jgi:MFS family permease
MRELFSYGNARRFFVANALAVFGDTALLLVLAIWAKELTGSTQAAGGIFVAVVIPSLLAPLAGPTIDRLPRRWIMAALNLVAGGIVLALLVVNGKGQLWVLYFVAAASGLAQVVYQGARAGFVVDLIPDHLLAYGNAVVRTSRQMLSVASPLIGAGMYTAIGGHAVTAIVSASLVASAAVLMTIRHDEHQPTVNDDEGLRRLATGVRHLVRVPTLRRTTLALCVSLLVAGFYELSLFEVIDSMGRQPTFMGVLVSIQGAGAIVGGVTAGYVAKRVGDLWLAGCGFATQAVGIGLTLAGALPSVAVGVALFGLGLPWILVGTDTAVMRSTKPSMQGRVNTALEAITSVPYTASFAVAVAVLGTVGHHLLLAIMASVTALCFPLLIVRHKYPFTIEEDEADKRAAVIG